MLGPGWGIFQEFARFAGNIAILGGWRKGDILILVSFQGVLCVVFDWEAPWKEYAPHLQSTARSSAVRTSGWDAQIKYCSLPYATPEKVQEVAKAVSAYMLLYCIWREAAWPPAEEHPRASDKLYCTAEVMRKR